MEVLGRLVVADLAQVTRVAGGGEGEQLGRDRLDDGPVLPVLHSGGGVIAAGLHDVAGVDRLPVLPECDLTPVELARGDAAALDRLADLLRLRVRGGEQDTDDVNAAALCVRI